MRQEKRREQLFSRLESVLSICLFFFTDFRLDMLMSVMLIKKACIWTNGARYWFCSLTSENANSVRKFITVDSIHYVWTFLNLFKLWCPFSIFVITLHDTVVRAYILKQNAPYKWRVFLRILIWFWGKFLINRGNLPFFSM